jgi:hypothetical protein
MTRVLKNVGAPSQNPKKVNRWNEPGRTLRTPEKRRSGTKRFTRPGLEIAQSSRWNP